MNSVVNKFVSGSLVDNLVTVRISYYVIQFLKVSN
jgi:hypothetical protein